MYLLLIKRRCSFIANYIYGFSKRKGLSTFINLQKMGCQYDLSFSCTFDSCYSLFYDELLTNINFPYLRMGRHKYDITLFYGSKVLHHAYLKRFLFMQYSLNLVLGEVPENYVENFMVRHLV